MPQWNQVNYKVGTNAGSSENISFGKGVNTYLSPYVGQQGAIDKNTSPQADNCIVNQYPILEPRKGLQRSFHDNVHEPFLTTFYSVARRNNYPILHVGTVVYAWDGAAWVDATAATGAATAASSKFVNFNTGGTLHTIFGNASELRDYVSTSSFASIADANKPLTNMLCVDDRRVFGLVGNILKFSAAGDHTDWTTANDAGQIEIVGMKGTPIGCVSYQNTVIVYSTQTMHILYGDETDDYVLSDPMEIGVVSDKSVIEHRGILYFLSEDKKIYAYVGGGIPVEISQPVQYWLNSMSYTYNVQCAGAYDKYILFSIPIGQSYNTHTLVYDTDLKIWQKWDVGFNQFINAQETFNIKELHGFVRNKQLYQLFNGDYVDDTDTSNVSWNYYTGYWTEGTVKSKKVLTSITCHVYNPSGSTITLGYEADKSGSFTTIQTFSNSSNDQIVRVEVPSDVVYDVSFFRLKFTCFGEGKIYSIEPEYRIKRR